MRVALHTRLKPETIEEYERAHRNVPADLLAAIRKAGAHEWTIWRSGVDLFHVVVCDDYARLLAELAPLPVNVEWQAYMGSLLAVSHDYGDDGASAVLPVVWELPGE